MTAKYGPFLNNFNLFHNITNTDIISMGLKITLDSDIVLTDITKGQKHVLHWKDSVNVLTANSLNDV